MCTHNNLSHWIFFQGEGCCSDPSYSTDHVERKDVKSLPYHDPNVRLLLLDGRDKRLFLNGTGVYQQTVQPTQYNGRIAFSVWSIAIALVYWSALFLGKRDYTNGE